VASAIEQLVQALAKLPSVGPRSARRLALHLLTQKEARIPPLEAALARAKTEVVTCHICGALDDCDPCHICTEPARNRSMICLVESVADVWAMERSRTYKGLYHVLGGTLSAMDGRGPEALRVHSLLARLSQGGVEEVILALGATVAGQTTAHYVADKIAPLGVNITRLGQGMPVGGELDYLDDGTLLAAMQARLPY
jgi:recombination protein RecR